MCRIFTQQIKPQILSFHFVISYLVDYTKHEHRAPILSALPILYNTFKLLSSKFVHRNVTWPLTVFDWFSFIQRLLVRVVGVKLININRFKKIMHITPGTTQGFIFLYNVNSNYCPLHLSVHLLIERQMRADIVQIANWFFLNGISARDFTYKEQRRAVQIMFRFCICYLEGARLVVWDT